MCQVHLALFAHTADRGLFAHGIRQSESLRRHAGYSNGDLLFQFAEARATGTAVSLGRMSVGQQWQVTLKLRKLAAGNDADLSFQLWDNWSAEDASQVDSSSTTEQQSTETSTTGSEDNIDNASTQRWATSVSDQQDTTLASSSNNGSSRHDSDAQQAGDLMMHAAAQGVLSPSETADSSQQGSASSSNGYNASSRRQWYAPPSDPQSASTHGDSALSVQDAHHSGTDNRDASLRQNTHQHASTSAADPVPLTAAQPPRWPPNADRSSSQEEQKPNHRLNGSTGPPATAPPGQDDSPPPPVLFPWPRALTWKERRVPCYMWHEARPPTSVLLTAPQSKSQTTAEDEAESEAEAAEVTTADDDTFPSRTQLLNMPNPAVHSGTLALLQPILQLVLKLWRCLPYWFRRLLQPSNRRSIPELHASPVLAEHIRSDRRDAVPGSSFNFASGQLASFGADSAQAASFLVLD